MYDCVQAYVCITRVHAILYTRITICVPCPTQDRMDFSRFRRLVLKVPQVVLFPQLFLFSVVLEIK